MNIKSAIQLFLFLIILIITASIFDKYYKKNTEKKVIKNKITNEEIQSSKEEASNILEGIQYFSEDLKGNIYKIKSEYGKIDIKDSNIIYMTNVIADINLVDSTPVKITSKYAIYNNKNYDTKFYENVLVTYVNHKLSGDLLDFYFDKNFAEMNDNVYYQGPDTKLYADKIEIDLATKDSKILMKNYTSILDEFLNTNKKKVKVINNFK
jgi:hypothetical protein